MWHAERKRATAPFRKALAVRERDKCYLEAIYCASSPSWNSSVGESRRFTEACEASFDRLPRLSLGHDRAIMRVETQWNISWDIDGFAVILGNDVNMTTDPAALIGTAAACDNAAPSRESGNATPARASGTRRFAYNACVSVSLIRSTICNRVYSMIRGPENKDTIALRIKKNIYLQNFYWEWVTEKVLEPASVSLSLWFGDAETGFQT